MTGRSRALTSRSPININSRDHVTQLLWYRHGKCKLSQYGVMRRSGIVHPSSMYSYACYNPALTRNCPPRISPSDFVFGGGCSQKSPVHRSRKAGLQASESYRQVIHAGNSTWCLLSYTGTIRNRPARLRAAVVVSPSSSRKLTAWLVEAGCLVAFGQFGTAVSPVVHAAAVHGHKTGAIIYYCYTSILL